MYSLVVSKRFKRTLRSFLKKHPDLEQTIDGCLSDLQHDPFSSHLKTHHLTGKLKGTATLSITYEYRLVFSIEGDQILLLAIGTHDEVY